MCLLTYLFKIIQVWQFVKFMISRTLCIHVRDLSRYAASAPAWRYHYTQRKYACIRCHKFLTVFLIALRLADTLWHQLPVRDVWDMSCRYPEADLGLLQKPTWSAVW